jgi:septum formation protein
MQSKKFLILASSSKNRLQLLKSVSIEPDLIISPDADEDHLPKELPRPYCQRVTENKFQAALKKLEKEKLPTDNYIVLVADTTAAVGRRLLHKTYDAEQVRKHLELISGRRHKLYTSVICGLVENGEVKAKRQRTVLSTLKFKKFSIKEIDELVKSRQSEGMAGGYTLSGLASKSLKFISGSYSNIIGLPLYETSQILTSLGYN